METGSIVGVGAGSGVLGIILMALFKYCYKKELHTKCKSACCETSVDVEDNSTPAK
jgi:hypothetical protein